MESLRTRAWLTGMGYAEQVATRFPIIGSDRSMVLRARRGRRRATVAALRGGPGTYHIVMTKLPSYVSGCRLSPMVGAPSPPN